MSAYDHILFSPEIVQNSFKKAGITSAIGNEIVQTDTETLFDPSHHVILTKSYIRRK